MGMEGVVHGVGETVDEFGRGRTFSERKKSLAAVYWIILPFARAKDAPDNTRPFTKGWPS